MHYAVQIKPSSIYTFGFVSFIVEVIPFSGLNYMLFDKNLKFM